MDALWKNKKFIELDQFMPVIREKLELGGQVQLLASGNSMYPLLRHGRDTIILEHARGEECRKYDVILYQRENGQYVLHRIIGCKEDGFILRGDHQYVKEFSVRNDQVIGKMVAFKRKGKICDTDTFLYRIYVYYWVNSAGIRRVFHALGSRIKGWRQEA